MNRIRLHLKHDEKSQVEYKHKEKNSKKYKTFDEEQNVDRKNPQIDVSIEIMAVCMSSGVIRID